MKSLSALRADPFYAPMFARVHVLCWLVFWWQLKRLRAWYHREGITGGFFSVNRWGIITVHYVDDKIDPDAYRPLARTFRPLTDPSWGSNLPACLGALTTEANRNPLILPRAAGGGGSPQRGLTEGALTSPLPDSS